MIGAMVFAGVILAAIVWGAVRHYAARSAMTEEELKAADAEDRREASIL